MKKQNFACLVRLGNVVVVHSSGTKIAVLFKVDQQRIDDSVLSSVVSLLCIAEKTIRAKYAFAFPTTCDDVPPNALFWTDILSIIGHNIIRR